VGSIAWEALSASTHSLIRVFAGTWLAYAGFYLCRKNFSVVMPLLSRDYGFSKDDLASLIFAYSLAYACGQFLAGTLADRYGAKPVVAAGMILSAVATLAMPGSRVLWALAGLQLMNGAAQSAGWPGLIKITAAWFGPARRGVLMAWWSTNYVVGGFLGTILATWFATGPLTARIGWKGGFLGPALLLLTIAVVFSFLATARPHDAGRKGESSIAVWREVLASPTLRSIAVCYFCLKLMRYTFLFWLPLYMVERLGYTTADAGYLSSAYELLGFLGVPLAGYLSDGLMRGRRFPVATAMLTGLALAFLVFPRLSALSYTANLCAIGLVGVLTFGPDTLMGGAATQDAIRPEAAATSAGFVNGVGSVGQLTSPFLVTAVVRWSGWDGLFGLFVVVSLIGAAALATQWNAGGRTAEARLANA